MTPAEYTAAAERTINRDLTPDEQLGAQALGLMAEAGEVANDIKKHLYQGRELDKAHVLEECGDTLWSLANLIRMMGGTIEGVMEANVAKLKARYPDGFPVKCQNGPMLFLRCRCQTCKSKEETMVDRWPIEKDS